MSEWHLFLGITDQSLDGCGDLELYTAALVTVWKNACSSDEKRYVCEVSPPGK